MDYDIVDVAENGWGLIPPFGGVRRREVTPELILVDQQGPTSFRYAIRVRFPDAPEERIAAVRAWFAAEGSSDFTWVLGTTARPSDLAERLLADGAVEADEDPEMAAMVLTEPPEGPACGDVRLSETFDDLLVARDLTAAIFGVPPEDVPSDEEMRGVWNGRSDTYRTYIAYVDGVPVGRASCSATELGPIELMNGGVLPQYRGRGVYRALVRARWDDAVGRGTPVLVTQAGAMSRPPLERLGFRTVGSIRRLVDRVDR